MAPSAPVLVLLSLLALPATGTAASARAAAPFHVELVAPAGCTSVEAVVRNVERRFGRARRGQPGERGPRFKLRITAGGARVRGVLSVVDERGETEDRTVEGASCDEIVEALSLTMALALSSDSKPVQPLPSRGATRAAAPARTRSASAARVPANPPAPAPAPTPTSTSPPAPAAAPPPASAIEPAPSPAPQPSAPAPPPPPVAEPAIPAPPPAAASAAPAVEAPADVAPSRLPSRLTVGAAAVVAQPVSPPISVGGALSLAMAWPTAETTSLGGAPTHIGLSVIHVANDYLQSPRDLVARWTAVAVAVCPPLGLGGRVELQPCGRATAGWLSARDPDIAVSTPAARSWFSLGALLRLSIPIGGGFALETSAGVEFPLVERRFIITSPTTPVGETPRAAGWAGLGLTWSL